MSERWQAVELMSKRTWHRVQGYRDLLPHVRVTDTTALTATPVYHQTSQVVTEGYDGHRRLWLVCGDGSLIETPESLTATVLWQAERAARGGAR